MDSRRNASATAAVIGRKPRRPNMSKALPYVLVAPLLLWLFATILIPVSNVIKDSLFNTNYVGTTGKYVGLGNYLSVLKDAAYWEAWETSLLWVLGCTVVQTVLGFATALLLNHNTHLTRTLRTWVIVPWIIPTIVVAILWQWILNGSYGVMNDLLLKMHIISAPISLIGNAKMALVTVILINVWHWFPFTAIIILAGLGTIPNELYESAAVEGANAVQTFFKITLPSLQNITFTLGVVGTLWCFNIFDMIWLLTSGGPLSITTTVPAYIYRGAFQKFKIGRTSAASVITSVLLFALAIVLIRATKPKDD
ncbi:MAG: sugar ABC transporter permease [Candidatus Limiplasma sp.]|nr:sugar ABC transporter permease [Candidatus Limiplasma sp.]